MTATERVQELIAWSAVEPVQPFDMNDIHRNMFERLFREFVTWSEEHPELFNVDDKIII